MFSVAARGLPPIEVQALNWVVALGFGLERLGHVSQIERMACEVLPNGTVIVRDTSSGHSYVVQGTIDDTDATTESLPVADLDFEATDLPTMEEVEDENAICRAALDQAKQVVEVESGSVIVDQAGHLEFVAAFGPGSEKVLGVKLPLGTGVAGYAMQRRRAVVLGNATDDPRHFPEIDRVTGVNTREMAVIPICTDTDVFGVIELLNLPLGQRFSRERLHQLQNIANTLGKRLAELA